METFSMLLTRFAENPVVTNRFPSQRPVIWIFDGFFYIGARTNYWANNPDAGDSRCHRAHCNITVVDLIGVLIPHSNAWISFVALKKYVKHRWINIFSLTHCGLVTPYGDRDLVQHLFKYWLVVWWHQAITWTNVGWSSVRSCGIHRRALSWEDLKIPISKTRLKITFLE